MAGREAVRVRRAERGCFEGACRARVDKKGRLALPKRFAARLGSPCVVTRSAGGCLLLLPEGRWRRVAAAHENGDFLGFYVSGAARVAVESRSGRIVVPAALRAHAGLVPGTDAQVVGLGRAVVLTRPDVWDAWLREFELRILGLARSLRGSAGSEGS